MYINFWYAMELSDNVTDESPQGVRVLGQDFVLFRDDAGVAHCLHDVCSHRGGSLSRGKRKNDCVECPYHGWQFNGEGTCTKIPSLGPENQKIPARTKIDSYPTQERFGIIFAFLGDLAEGERPPLFIPELNHYDHDYPEDEWRPFTLDWTLSANYERIVENALDPAHNEFVHPAHGYAGEKDSYRIPDFDLLEHEWGNGFFITYDDAPPSTDELMHSGDTSRDFAGNIDAGAGHSGPNHLWTYVHFTQTNKMHQYLWETPIDASTTRTFNLSFFNFLPETTSWDDVNNMTQVIAGQDVVVLEAVKPGPTPDDMTSEVMMPADRSIVKYRHFLKEWNAKGWRIDSKTIDPDKVYAIPSPRRRKEKGWVFPEMPLVKADV